MYISSLLYTIHDCVHLRCNTTTFTFDRKIINLHLACFRGHARHILTSLSPSQPVSADEEIIRWGTLLLNLFFRFYFGLLLLLAVKSLFPFFFMHGSALDCNRRAFFSHRFAFCGTVFLFLFWRDFFLYATCEYIPACCRRASSHICYHHITASTASTASTAQQYSTARSNPRDKQHSKHAPIRARLTQASRRSWHAHIYNSPVCSLHERRNRIFSAYKTTTGGMTREGFACTLPSFSPSFLFGPYMRRPACFGGPQELLAFASRYVVRTEKRGTSPLTFSHSHFVHLLFVSERSGRPKPPAKRSGRSRPRSEAPRV